MDVVREPVEGRTTCPWKHACRPTAAAGHWWRATKEIR